MKTKRFQCCIFLLAVVLILSVFPVSAQEVPAGMEEAAASLRDGIKNWENFVTVTFTVDPDSFDGTNASANVLANQVLDHAGAGSGAG